MAHGYSHVQEDYSDREDRMKALKIVSEEDDGLFSAAAGGEAGVRYIPGQDTEAPKHMAEKGYHILVFDSLENIVREYGITTVPHLCIWKCECTNQVELPERLDIYYLSRLGLDAALLHPSSDWPYGTMMFEKVRLIERIG